MTMNKQKPILIVNGLKKYYYKRNFFFSKKKTSFKAVDDVSFSIGKGEVVGLIGESGSGKTTLGLSLTRLVEPSGGNVFFDNTNLLLASKTALQKIRMNIQTVFQDPSSSLNPKKTILENIGAAPLYHGIIRTKDEQSSYVQNILKLIEIPLDSLTYYPHQFSGGQQQRISIGRALAMNPKLLICDEVVSALDLSVQAQILNVLSDLKNTLKLSFLFISHNLPVVRHFCSRLLIMYRGKIVESGPTEAIFTNPKHPYTEMLLASQPYFYLDDKEKSSKIRASYSKSEGNTIEPLNPDGCVFYHRCPLRERQCLAHPERKKSLNDHHYNCIH